jgi:hypothetical protein
MDRQTDTQTERQAGRQAGRLADRDKQSEIASWRNEAQTAPSSTGLLTNVPTILLTAVTMWAEA